LTVVDAVLVLPVPPLVEWTVTLLSIAPTLVPVTLTENVQLAPSASVAPDRLTDDPPAVAVIVPPPQDPVRPFGVETTRPAGNESVNPTPVAEPFPVGLVIVNDRLVDPFSGIDAAPNDLEICGGATTVTVSVALAPLPPSFELTVLVRLTFAPAVVPVTLTENVHALLAASVAPLKLTLDEPATAVIVPAPHAPVRPFGVETTRPAGSESLNPTPVSAVVAFGLVTVNERLVVPFSGIDEAPNDFDNAGGATTVIDAVAVLPVPPSVELTLTLLFFTPAVVPVTLTENVQLSPPASVAPLKLTLDEPASAVIVPPPQDPVRPFGVETSRPAGSVSVNPIPVDVPLAAALVIVNDMLVDPFSGIDASVKDLVICTGPAATSNSAVAAAPVPPSFELTVLVVFIFAPAAVPVTLTENVHAPLAAKVAPLKLTLDDPATAVIVPPPQLPISPFGVETTTPSGSVSVNPMPVSTVLAFGLVTVNDRLDDPFSGIDEGVNDFDNAGGATTVTEAVAVFPVPPLSELTLTLLFFTPAVVPVTLTENVQLSPSASDAPDRVTLESPAVAVIVPPAQPPDRPFGVETTRPAGNVSVNPTPVALPFPAGLVTVNDRFVDPPNGIDPSAKDLEIEGGATTLTDAVAVLPVPPLSELTGTLLFFTPALTPVTFSEIVQLEPSGI
jgi:hypothetical protein